MEHLHWLRHALPFLFGGLTLGILPGDGTAAGTVTDPPAPAPQAPAAGDLKPTDPPAASGAAPAPVSPAAPAPQATGADAVLAQLDPAVLKTIEDHLKGKNEQAWNEGHQRVLDQEKAARLAARTAETQATAAAAAKVAEATAKAEAILRGSAEFAPGKIFDSIAKALVEDGSFDTEDQAQAWMKQRGFVAKPAGVPQSPEELNRMIDQRVQAVLANSRVKDQIGHYATVVAETASAVKTLGPNEVAGIFNVYLQTGKATTPEECAALLKKQFAPAAPAAATPKLGADGKPIIEPPTPAAAGEEVIDFENSFG
jgi:hypothetical protein